MTTKFLTLVLASTACVWAFTACQGKSKARIAQRVVETTHDPGACPSLAEGHYRLANQNSSDVIPNFLDVSRNDGRELTISFDGKEKFLVNGKEQPKSDGTKFSLGCAAGKVNVAGTDSKGKRTQFTLAQTDKGIDMSQSQPTKEVLNYERTGAVGTAIDKALKHFDKNQSPSGIPGPDDIETPGEQK